MISHAIFAQKYQFNGNARALAGSKLLYQDFHTEVYQGKKHSYSQIVYKKDGYTIARKKITFAKYPEAPDFTLTDYRDGYLEGARVSAKQVTILYRKNNKEKLKKKTISRPKNLVVDGGFDYFVRQNWQKLANGQKLTFNFLAPSQMDYFRFSARKYKTGTFRGKKALFIKLELNSLLNVFFKPIYLTYDYSNQRIIQYKGISNINDNNGKSYFVHITYPDYP